MSKNQRRGLSSFDALGDMFNIPKINDSKQLGIVTEANSYTGEFKIKNCRDNCLHNYIETTEKKKSIKKDMSVIFEMDESNNSIKNPKFFNYSYCVPNETLLKLLNDNSEFGNFTDNFALQLNKYAKLTIRDNKKSFALSFPDEINGFNTAKFDFEKCYNSINRINSCTIAEKLFGKNNIKTWTFKTNWRMAIGLGTESIYETGMTLHHTYGIPYIPGQALKGIVRSWIIKKYFYNGFMQRDIDPKKDDSREIAAFCDKLFCLLFGCPEYAYKKGNIKSALNSDYMGSVTFFDAFPNNLNGNTVKIDIMNPHYGEYYSDTDNKKPPADYYNPVPVNFLTVQDTEFQFVLGIKEDKNETIADFDGVNTDTLLNIAEKYLKEALKEMGVGAKTAVGYGYFSETK